MSLVVLPADIAGRIALQLRGLQDSVDEQQAVDLQLRMIGKLVAGADDPRF
jgi:hypothetical protein